MIYDKRCGACHITRYLIKTLRIENYFKMIPFQKTVFSPEVLNSGRNEVPLPMYFAVSDGKKRIIPTQLIYSILATHYKKYEEIIKNSGITIVDKQ